LTTQVHGNVSQHSRTVTLILCLFLGGFGAHRFYVGKSGSAVALLFLTICTGLGGIWAFIDLIMILIGSFTDNFGRYVSSWDGGPTPTAQYATQPPTPAYTQPPPTYTPPPPQKRDDEIFCNTCGALSKKHETYCRSCGAVLQH
jgi:TM2 domain-containing membrane protein YozV